MIWRLFRRRSKPLAPQPEFEKDWTPGDRAECIADAHGARGQWTFVRTGSAGPGPSRGQILRVIHVYADEHSVWLVFAELFPFSFPAGHFRKLRACSTDFREQLRKRAPAPVRALEDAPA